MNKELLLMWKGNTQKVRVGTGYQAEVHSQERRDGIRKVKLKLVRDVRKNRKGFFKYHSNKRKAK